MYLFAVLFFEFLTVLDLVPVFFTNLCFTTPLLVEYLTNLYEILFLPIFLTPFLILFLPIFLTPFLILNLYLRRTEIILYLYLLILNLCATANLIPFGNYLTVKALKLLSDVL